MGPYQGGQAEYVRVPFADFNALKLPPGKEHEEDFALLADIFPTVRCRVLTILTHFVFDDSHAGMARC